MKKFLVIAVSVVLIAMLLEPAFAASGYFFWDDCYKGTKLTIPKGTEKSSLEGCNDKISSYKIDRGVECVITTGSEFRGDYKYITGSAKNMPSVWNDTVSSIKCTPIGYFAQNHTADSTGYAFVHNHFAGNKFKLTSITSMASIGAWSDEFSSIRLGNNITCEFYENENFEGNKLVLSPKQAYNRLSDCGWNDRISSILCSPVP